MDCGPAALKAMLEGFGVGVSYGRLREACQTDVDGTSIDTVEDTAVQLGLDAEQVMVPLDHLFEPETRSLPSIVPVRLPNGGTHFVVFWRESGPWVQVMDPARGRRWTTRDALSKEVLLHAQQAPAADWREWAGGGEFVPILRRRLARLGVNRAEQSRLLDAALGDSGWRSLAALDAAARMAASLVRAGAAARGSEAARLCARLAAAPEEIPPSYWSARSADDEAQVLLRGAVLVRVRGRRKRAADEPPLPRELAAALDQSTERPFRELLARLRPEGLAPVLLLVAVAFAAAGVIAEAVLLRGLFDLGRLLVTGGQSLGAIALLAGFSAILWMVEYPVASSTLRLGRKLEGRLRLHFHQKVPLLGDRYFRSRLSSDMAERCHMSHRLRELPELLAHLFRAACELAFTAAAICWLDPGSAAWTLALAVSAAGIPLLAQPALLERDLRWRSHTGALSRFYYDALQGLTAVRTHGAGPALRREQSALLAEWARTGLELQRIVVRVEGLQFLVTHAIAVWILFDALGLAGRGPRIEAGSLLLLVYWTLNLPSLGLELAELAWQYPAQRNIALRLIEPLNAPDEEEAAPVTAPEQPGGAAVDLHNVAVVAAGQTILSGIDLSISPGSHVAVVGSSGAGKSSLVGLLLGWHRPSQGEVLVDGRPLWGAELSRLRRQTAWIDPQVQLWNRTLLDNLLYGSPPGSVSDVAPAMESADLSGLLRRLPEGLQTVLGENGGLVSGGEGQRVRIGRALLRENVRLVILDEPARGLDHGRRRAILERARRRWPHATLLAITHDVGATLGFDRVLVIEEGRIVEDGLPSALAAREGSRYAALLEAEERVRRDFWSGGFWKRLRMEDGRLLDPGAGAA